MEGHPGARLQQALWGTLLPKPHLPGNTGETWGQRPLWLDNPGPQCPCFGKYRAGRQAPPWALGVESRPWGWWVETEWQGQHWLCLRGRPGSEVPLPQQVRHQ